MSTNQSFSMGAFLEWGNSIEKAQSLQEAGMQDFKRNLAKFNYPSKDEVNNGILDGGELDMSHTLAAIPGAVTQFMSDTGRKFDLPAVYDGMASATIRIDDIPETTHKGVNQMGPHKGEPYESVTAAHSEIKVKSHNKPFKK